MTAVYALIVGGGTAGHVLPGIAIGNELVRRGHPPESIHFVGSERGVEKTLVPEAGFPLTLLPGRGIQRRLTTDNIGSIIGLAKAFGQSRSLLVESRPKVVVALGGYASVPAGLWAVLRRVPVVVAEQNAVPGLANKIIGRFAKQSAISYEGTELPRSTWTGNPVRADVLAVASDDESRRATSRTAMGVGPEQKLVVVFGGSLGARTINNALIDAYGSLADRADIAIRHIIGRRDFADVTSRIPTNDADKLTYVPIEYESDMATVYDAADLVVCRAGATSCAELAVTGTPAVLVPLPGAPGDHQTANARALERVGGAELIPDSIFDGTMLVSVVERLLANPEQLADMAAAASGIARPDAAANVVDIVEQYGGVA